MTVDFLGGWGLAEVVVVEWNGTKERKKDPPPAKRHGKALRRAPDRGSLFRQNKNRMNATEMNG